MENNINIQGYHIGLIPDGNRRWAKKKGISSFLGHRKGAEKLEMFIEWCLDNKDISEISIYALSEENFKRSKQELNNLYDLYNIEFKKLMKKEKIHKGKVKVNIISTNIKPVPKNLINLFERTMAETKSYSNKVLNLLIGYTGQSEILRSISSPLNRIKNLFFGLNERDIENSLKVKRPCDFIIRTGAEEKKREAKSGFLLWQSAYSEYYHIDKFFPEITKRDLKYAWDYFKKTARRKGL